MITKYCKSVAGILLIMFCTTFKVTVAQPVKVKHNKAISPTERIADSYEAETYYLYNKGSGKGRLGGVTANMQGPSLYSESGYVINFAPAQTDWYDYSFIMKKGRNGDPTFITPKNNWLRIGAPSGVVIWGNGKQETDDNPTLLIGNGSSQFSGSLGIGTSPSYPFHVSGVSLFTNGNGNSHIPYTDGNIYLSGPNLYVRDKGNTTRFTFDNTNGRLGIGTSLSNISANNLSNYNLFVTKGILTEKYGLAPVGSWADYVFHQDYTLLSINEMDKFIRSNGHLPNIPSAEDIATNGYNLHDMNVKFLEKIEELTLYIISQEKEIERMEKELRNYSILPKRIEELEQSIKKKD